MATLSQVNRLPLLQMVEVSECTFFSLFPPLFHTFPLSYITAPTQSQFFFSFIVSFLLSFSLVCFMFSLSLSFASCWSTSCWQHFSAFNFFFLSLELTLVPSVTMFIIESLPFSFSHYSLRKFFSSLSSLSWLFHSISVHVACCFFHWSWVSLTHSLSWQWLLKGKF